MLSIIIHNNLKLAPYLIAARSPVWAVLQFRTDPNYLAVLHFTRSARNISVPLIVYPGIGSPGSIIEPCIVPGF